MSSRRRSDAPGRIGSTLVAVGCLGVLGLTFGVGFYSGRHWPRPPLTAADADAGSPGSTGGAISSRLPARGAPPALTFYEELTAPLTPPAPPAKVPPRKPAPPAAPGTQAVAAERRSVEKAAVPAPRPEERAARVAAEAPRRSEPARAGRFTVQIAAYSARASAEALRSSVSASGHEAYIVESDGPPGAPRYRVRVGSYASRDAAIAAASRLPVPGPHYVTTR
jgi:cell division septation protein DedD